MTARASASNAFRTAILAGAATSFVVAVGLVRSIRPALLLDPDPAWTIPRFLLWIALLSATSAAGALAAGLFFLWRRSERFPLVPTELPFRGKTLALVAAGALLVGTVLRFVALDRIPPSLWVDDVSLIAPALDLEGNLSDLSDMVRAAPYGVPQPYGSVGVLYLELYRLALVLVGETVFGIRFLSAAAGVLSLVTAMFLGRALLPRGGGALAVLVLAGLRWHLLLSRWAWNAIVLAPIADLAALLLLRARRRGSLLLGAASGLVAGLATHIYLAAWIVGAALLALAVWPDERGSSGVFRLRLALTFTATFALAAAPLFLLKEGRTSPYFARASDHNLWREVGYMHSPLPAFAAVADSLTAPWFAIEPYGHHDLPGTTRLNVVLGVAVAVAFARSLVRLLEPFSAYLLANAAAALAASVAGGHAGLPNSYRFAYLTTATAVAAAGGILCILGRFFGPARRVAAIVAIGLLSVSGALATRDALLRWPARRETFDGFHGADTLLGRSILRWERYGDVVLGADLENTGITLEGIRRYRLDPDYPREAPRGSSRGRKFRVVPPGSTPHEGDRLVERVGDVWGREWGWVYGRGQR